MTNDKFATKIVKKFCKKQGILTMKDTWSYFGDVTVRIISVGRTDNWDYRAQDFSRAINVEITMKKEGVRFSENNIPSNNSWSARNRMRFFKNRKYYAQENITDLLKRTELPLFFRMATIPFITGSDFVGNITYKFID